MFESFSADSTLKDYKVKTWPHSCVAMEFMDLPPEMISRIISFLRYEDIANYVRPISKELNNLAMEKLNVGFEKVTSQETELLRKISSQLSKRHSKRKAHPLYPHYSTLRFVDTNLSYLQTVFNRWILEERQCFMPGLILDELFKLFYKVKDSLKIKGSLSTGHAISELKDLVPMAVDYFKEQIDTESSIPSDKAFLTDRRRLGRFAEPKSPSQGLQVDTDQRKLIEDFQATITTLDRKVRKQGKEIADQGGKIGNLMNTVSYQYKRIAELSAKLSSQASRIEEQNLTISLFVENNFKKSPRVVLPKYSVMVQPFPKPFNESSSEEKAMSSADNPVPLENRIVSKISEPKNKKRNKKRDSEESGESSKKRKKTKRTNSNLEAGPIKEKTSETSSPMDPSSGSNQCEIPEFSVVKATNDGENLTSELETEAHGSTKKDDLRQSIFVAKPTKNEPASEMISNSDSGEIIASMSSDLSSQDENGSDQPNISSGEVNKEQPRSNIASHNSAVEESRKKKRKKRNPGNSAEASRKEKNATSLSPKCESVKPHRYSDTAMIRNMTLETKNSEIEMNTQPECVRGVGSAEPMKTSEYHAENRIEVNGSEIVLPQDKNKSDDKAFLSPTEPRTTEPASDTATSAEVSNCSRKRVSKKVKSEVQRLELPYSETAEETDLTAKDPFGRRRTGRKFRKAFEWADLF